MLGGTNEMIWSTLNLLLWTLILHELGHFLYFKIVAKRDVEIRISCQGIKRITCRIGYPLDYKILEQRQKYELYAAGILMGLLPLMLAVFINAFYSILLPVYFFACRNDIKNIWRVTHGQGKNPGD